MADIEGVIDATTLENIAAEAKKEEAVTIPDTNVEGALGYEDLATFNDTDNIVLEGRAAVHRTIADYAESVPIANEFDWWKRRIVEPWRESQHRLEANIKYESGIERMAGEFVGGMVGLGLAIPIDTFLGGKILKGAKYLNPKLYSVLTATRKTGQLAGSAYMPTWAFGMTARHGLQTFHATDHDVLQTGLAMAESAAQGFVFGAMPRNLIGGAWGMFTAGIGFQGYEDLKRGELSSPQEYLFTAANFVGMHAALAISHGITGANERERTLAEGITQKLLQGKAAISTIEELIADSTISDGMREQLRDMRSAIAMEMNKDWRVAKAEDAKVPWDEIFPAEEMPRAKFLNSGLIEKGIEESLQAWERGDVELWDLIDKNAHVDKAIEEGLIEIDDRGRTWNWNPDMLQLPESNVITMVDKEPIFKWKPALGSEDNPISSSERGLDYIMQRLESTVIGDPVHVDPRVNMSEKGSPVHKQEKQFIRSLLEDWMKVDRNIVDTLTIEMWNSKEFVSRVAKQLEYNRSLSPEQALEAAKVQESGTMGMYDHNMFIIDLFLPFTMGKNGWSLGEVFAHEFGHHLTHWIPKEHLIVLRDEFNRKKDLYLNKFTGLDREIVKEYMEKGIVRREWGARGRQIIDPSEVYRFTHEAEFWAETVRDMFRKDYKGLDYKNEEFNKLMHATWKGLLSFFNMMRRSVGEMAFSRETGMAQQIYRKMMQGDLRLKTDGFYQSPTEYFDALSDFTFSGAAKKKTLADIPGGELPMLRPQYSATTWRNEVARPLGMTMEEWREFRRKDLAEAEANVNNLIEEWKKRNGVDTPNLDVLDALLGDPDSFDIRLRGQRELRLKVDPQKEETQKKAEEHVWELYEEPMTEFREGLYRSVNTKYLNTSNMEAKEIVQIIAEQAADIIDRQRNPRSFESIERGAKQMDDINMGWIKKLSKRTENLARDVFKARTALMYSLERLAVLKGKSLAEDATAADAEALTEWYAIHRELHAGVAGSISEIARALAQQRMLVSADEIFNTTSIEDLARKIGKRKFPFTSAFVEAYKGWLFSNPATHLVNLSGNTAVQMGNIVEDFISAGLGKYVTNSADRLTFEEATRKTAATVTGAIDGLSYTLELLKEGSQIFEEKGFEEAEEFIRSRQIDPYTDKWNPDTKAWSRKSVWGEISPDATTMDRIMSRSFDLVGTLSRGSLHALGISDGFFRNVSYKRYITEAAIREANDRGLTGEDKANFIRDFSKAHMDVFQQNLRPLSKEQKEWGDQFRGDGSIHKWAWERAKEDVFARDVSPDSGMIGQAAEMGRQAVTKITPLQLLFPTWKTPVNILRYVGQRTPGLHRFSSEMRKDIEAGGRRRDQAYAKLLYGMSLYSLGFALASGAFNTVHTMGLSDDKSREALAGVGAINDSIRVGDKFYSLDNADPIGSFLLLPARLLDIIMNSVGVTGENEVVAFGQRLWWNGADPKDSMLGGGGRRYDVGEAISAVIVALSTLYTNKTFNKSLYDLLNVMSPQATPSERARFLQNILSNATTPFNGLMRFLNQQQGDVMREVEDFVDAFWKDKVPSKLKPRYDIFGREMTYNAKGMWMVRNTTFGNEPVDKEILRLELPVMKLQDDEWRGVEMTDEQKIRYNKILADMNIRQILNDVITKDKSYRKLADVPGSVAPGTKGYVLAKIINGYRRGAWGTLVNEDMKKNKGTASIPGKLEQHIYERMDPRRPAPLGFKDRYEQENLSIK